MARDVPGEAHDHFAARILVRCGIGSGISASRSLGKIDPGKSPSIP